MKRILAVASLAFACNAFAGGYFERVEKNFKWAEWQLTGWACDTQAPDFQGWIHFWRDGEFVGALPANVPREPAVGAACGGNHVHGFSGALKLPFGTYDLHAYFIPLNGNPFELTQSPLKINHYRAPFYDPIACGYYPGRTTPVPADCPPLD